MDPYSLVVKLVGVALGLGGVAFGGGYVEHKLDAGAYNALETKFSQYQTLTAAAEAKTRLNDLQAQQKFVSNVQAAVEAANARAAAAEAARGHAAQALADNLSKEGKASALLALCLSRHLPPSVLQRLAH